MFKGRAGRSPNQRFISENLAACEVSDWLEHCAQELLFDALCNGYRHDGGRSKSDWAANLSRPQRCCDATAARTLSLCGVLAEVNAPQGSSGGWST